MSMVTNLHVADVLHEIFCVYIYIYIHTHIQAWFDPDGSGSFDVHIQPVAPFINMF